MKPRWVGVAEGNAVAVGDGTMISLVVTIGGPAVEIGGAGTRSGGAMDCWARVSEVLRHEKSAVMSRRVK